MTEICDVCGHDFPKRELFIEQQFKSKDIIHKCRECIGRYGKYQLADLRQS